MLSFEEFAENVVKEIRVKVGGAFQIKEHKVIKNNSVKRAGIAVMKNEEDIGPCVYLDVLCISQCTYLKCLIILGMVF